MKYSVTGAVGKPPGAAETGRKHARGEVGGAAQGKHDQTPALETRRCRGSRGGGSATLPRW